MMQERLLRLLRGEAPAAPAWRMLGMRLTEAEEGRAVVVMECGEEMLNHQGVVHGGFVGALADSAMGSAMATVLPEGEGHVSFDLKLNLISPARPGDVVRAEARVLHLGRRTGVAEARLEAPGGRLVATSTASFAVHLPGGRDADR